MTDMKNKKLGNAFMDFRAFLFLSCFKDDVQHLSQGDQEIEQENDQDIMERIVEVY